MNGGSVVRIAFLIVFGVFLLLLVAGSPLSLPQRTKATGKSLTISVKLQGNHKAYSTIKAQVDIYGGPQRTTGDPALTLTETNGIFSGIMPLGSNFDFAGFYAVYVKPEKYTGRAFCKTDVTGKACNVPQMIFNSNGTAVNLAGAVYLGGDTLPGNGKVDAQDMSRIMKNLGLKNTPDTDIDNNGITDVTDYSLALYSLGQSAADDVVALQPPGTQPNPTSTPAPSVTGTPQTTVTPTPSTAPSATTAPTAVPTNQPTAVPTTAPTAVPPTATPKPTNTPTPTATAGGTCRLLPGNMAKTFCNIQPEDLAASPDFTPCTDSGGTGICAGKSKARCTCPSGVCTCQLLDQATQTVNCSNGGKIELQECQ